MLGVEIFTWKERQKYRKEEGKKKLLKYIKVEDIGHKLVISKTCTCICMYMLIYINVLGIFFWWLRW